jgi:general secretion pathway protein B
MSYILDALKKSEKKRMQGTVPDVLTAQEIVCHERRKRRLWPYLVIAALLVNALAVVWLVPWKSKEPSAVSESGVITRLASEEHDTATANTERPRTGSTLAMKSNTGGAKPSAQMKPQRSADETPRRLAAVKDQAQKKTSGISKPETGAKAIHDTTAESRPDIPAATAPSEIEHPVDVAPIPGKVYSMSELPLAVQQKLPSFGISVFLYSDDPTSRMVKINNKMLREGDYLSEGLKLEEIDQNSLILSYQNFRFRVGLK